MNCNNIQNFEGEENEIGSNSLDHQRLGNLSDNEMKHQIIESKKCLENKGFNVTNFSFPYNNRDKNKNILNIIADNYYIARLLFGRK